jgi:hypothetical protein
LREPIVGGLEYLSEAGAERAIIDSEANVERRSAPLRDQRICCDLLIRRFTRKLADPSVIAVPTRNPA